MAESEDVNTLKRRGRRRLVGAIALVLAAVIVLPMVFDPEPRRGAPPVSVRIPGEDEAPFKPKPVPKPPEKKAEQPPVQATAEKKAEEKVVLSKPVPARSAKPAPAERARAEAALAGAEYVVQVGVFADPASAIDKLKAAKLPYYTETLKDNLTRVRAGPFLTKEAAEKIREQLKGLGLDPGTVTTRAG